MWEGWARRPWSRGWWSGGRLLQRIGLSTGRPASKSTMCRSTQRIWHNIEIQSAATLEVCSTAGTVQPPVPASIGSIQWMFFARPLDRRQLWLPRPQSALSSALCQLNANKKGYRLALILIFVLSLTHFCSTLFVSYEMNLFCCLNLYIFRYSSLCFPCFYLFLVQVWFVSFRYFCLFWRIIIKNKIKETS